MSLELCQVAISGRKTLAEVEPWYVEGLGFEYAGGADFVGAEFPAVAGIDAPMLDTRLDWLVGRQGFFQLEYFHFKQPEVRPKREEWTLADIGYGSIGIHVVDFDATLERLAGLGSVPVAPVVGEAGDRRACLLDPSTVVVELMEKDVPTAEERPSPRPDGPAIRFIRATVGDLERSRRFFAETLGLESVATELHSAEQEAGLGAGKDPVETQVMVAGSCLLELVQYAEGVGRERPEGYRISDEGILNIACGSADPEPVREARQRTEAGPYSVHADLRDDEFDLNYVTDDQGFNVELVYIGAPKHTDFGFI
jgi:catechol 2,3-dioxygenase-like lactoylglutathione lyase family enzyme